MDNRVWCFPLHNSEKQTITNWKHNFLFPILMKKQRGTRSESLWSTNEGKVIPYEGCSGGLLSYLFTPEKPLTIEGSFNNNEPIPGKVVVKALGCCLDLRNGTSTGHIPCCYVSTNSHQLPECRLFQLTLEEMRKIETWLSENHIDPQSTITYEFVPTTIGLSTTILLEDGRRYDFTDYDTW
eukprot:TRINITY_DN12230_c0_g1_i1.p1 TRINITY_DN12230_c0_g1~~TRINITY_DN12230_c0_g1_i1.p1  ORF type:complete len:182 (-),score=8.78 TRINITY_DN12230_c0_g1_i1:256-801(-)